MTDQPQYAIRLRQLVLEAADRLASQPETVASNSLVVGKWSPKQIVGHLIDSACNNHARFVNAQRGEAMIFDGYDQEEWVHLQRYNTSTWSELIELWKSYNLHLAHVMACIPSDIRSRKFHRHNLDRIAWKVVPPSEAVDLNYLMEDYVGHLEHHLSQVWAIFDAA